MKKILILGSQSTNEGETAALDLMAQFTHGAVGQFQEAQVVSCHLDQLAFIASNQKTEIKDTRNNCDLADYDLVFLRGKLQTGLNDASLVSFYLAQHSVPTVNTAYANRRAPGKIPQVYQLYSMGLPFPKSVSASAQLLPQLIAEHLEYPIVVKDIYGSHGSTNFLVNNDTALKTVLQDNPGIRFIAQQMIENDGDYRVLVAGDSHLIIHRKGSPDSHLNNTSLGGVATLIPPADFSAEIVRQSRQFADYCNYEIAGVDVIIDRNTGQHYFLEINSQPQIASGAFVAEKSQLIGAYLSELLN